LQLWVFQSWDVGSPDGLWMASSMVLGARQGGSLVLEDVQAVVTPGVHAGVAAGMGNFTGLPDGASCPMPVPTHLSRWFDPGKAETPLSQTRVTSASCSSCPQGPWQSPLGSAPLPGAAGPWFARLAGRTLLCPARLCFSILGLNVCIFSVNVAGAVTCLSARCPRPRSPCGLVPPSLTLVRCCSLQGQGRC
jgi:hypothetical protein